ncbi:SRPBCC family protein [Gordonia sp. PKS22-38]|uniref:SRPBCC family protein n=1 Tax=Gordonia prachuapensis TaxID=3115651 RepID=A0ABU7MYM1_9ACTN|nr:SRPBCC family protein [Gordonia sp. PKS22-38]
MRQQLTTDTVERFVNATPQAVYDLISDVTRTPDLSPDVVSCTWLGGATGPAVGAEFKAVNDGRSRPNWSNRPIVAVCEPGREFAFRRTEAFAGTILWRYELIAENGGTRIRESYLAEKPVSPVGWFIIGGLYGRKDQAGDLRIGMEATLARIAEILEPPATPAEPATDAAAT